MIRIIATIIFYFAFNMRINNVIRKNEGVFCVPLQKDEGLLVEVAHFSVFDDDMMRNRCFLKLGNTY